MNCTARRFVDLAVASVTKQLGLTGVNEDAIDSELSYHFDPGYSFGEPAAVEEECSEDQLSHCADAVASLVSLDGLGEFLVDALEHGVASPKPERLSRLGWSSAANALLSTKVTGGGAVELGGGSGAGFQVICEDRGIATLGGGGGGGAFGWIEDHLGYLGARPVAKNETVGGGAGGGMQLFFPANVTGRPWEADHWISWGSGGGHGCGSCKAGDTFCEDSPLRITCGAKMDDNGAVDRAAGLQALRNWRVGVLRACYDAGKLAVIGGGGGGAGGARCCAAVPRLKYGFGFRAELRPQKASESTWFRSGLPKGKQCCPDLSGWNSTTMAVGLGSQLAQGFARRLSVAFGGLGGGALPDELAPLVDPFARENTGHQPPGHANRRPLLEELMKQHDKRLGVDRSELIARAANTETCALPAWLNMTQLTALNSRPGGDVSPDGSGTKEPEVALKYIFKFNPLQGYLADGASRCGGWSDWCCVCHAAQWQIACLPEVEKNAVDWFLTEDCCESKMRKDTSSPGYVADATPLRDSVVMWRPNVGWIELPRSMNVSDSYHWMGEYGDDGLCPTVAFPEMWIRANAADADANVPLMLGNVEHANAWSNTRVVATSAAVLGYMAQAALVIILLFMARLVKGGPRREQERYIQMTEV
mmetsp:Transcript_37449/g.80676  ORF Transcript_37449/g.80676 Transcript_37449/m.80676 type:complete len:648 (-) Transcript_37449:57-2000(-)